MKKEKMFKNEKESRTLSSADDVLSVRLGPPLPVTLVRLFCVSALCLHVRGTHRQGKESSGIHKGVRHLFQSQRDL